MPDLTPQRELELLGRAIESLSGGQLRPQPGSKIFEYHPDKTASGHWMAQLGSASALGFCTLNARGEPDDAANQASANPQRGQDLGAIHCTWSLQLRFNRERRGFGGQIDSRMISSGRIGITSGKVAWPRIRCSRMRAATVPMCWSGWRMVVKLGLW